MTVLTGEQWFDIFSRSKQYLFECFGTLYKNEKKVCGDSTGEYEQKHEILDWKMLLCKSLLTNLGIYSKIEPIK